MASHPPLVAVVAGTSVAPRMAPVVYGQLADRLSATVHTLSGAGFDHTLRSAAKLEKELEQLAGNTRKLPINGGRILVGHSQGGLVALLVAERRPDLVAGVITLGAPIHGTATASRWLPIPAVRCMAVDSRLVGMIPPADAFACRVINIVGGRDALVRPKSSGFLDGAEHLTVDAGHLGLILDRKSINFIARIVAEGPWPTRALAGGPRTIVVEAA